MLNFLHRLYFIKEQAIADVLNTLASFYKYSDFRLKTKIFASKENKYSDFCLSFLSNRAGCSDACYLFNYPRQLSPSQGHGHLHYSITIRTAPRPAHRRVSSDRASPARSAGATRVPPPPLSAEGSGSRVSNDAAMLSVSRATTRGCAFPPPCVPIPRVPPRCAEPFPPAAPPRACVPVPLLDEGATELSAPPHYPRYAAAQLRR
jgi:hypothetical protein